MQLTPLFSDNPGGAVRLHIGVLPKTAVALVQKPAPLPSVAAPPPVQRVAPKPSSGTYSTTTQQNFNPALERTDAQLQAEALRKAQQTAASLKQAPAGTLKPAETKPARK